MRPVLFTFAASAAIAIATSAAAQSDTSSLDAVSLSAQAPLTLDQFADALRSATGRPVLVGLSPEHSFLHDDAGHRLKVRWNGSLTTLLNSAAPRFGVQWAEDSGAILLFDKPSARPKAPTPPPAVQLVDVPPSNPPIARTRPVPPALAPIIEHVPAPPVAIGMAQPVPLSSPGADTAGTVQPPKPFGRAPNQPGSQEEAPLPDPVADMIAADRAATEASAGQMRAAELAATSTQRANPGSTPAVNMVSTDRVTLDAKEAYGVQLADRWKSNPDKPRQGEDGSVKYLYGATMPTLVCSPLEVCAIKLQAGEVVNDVHAGDTARWRITPANSGSGDAATTLVIVKPTDAGLSTNLFISTDRRVYSIKLVSTQKAWIPLLSFDYPDEVQNAWANFRQQQQQHVEATTLPTGENIAALDFRFKISGDHPRWLPQRVYTDGVKTYIQFPAAIGADEAPALVALGRGGGSATQMINYRVVGDRYEVDQVIDRAALLSGVGRDQARVLIEHKGR